MTKRTLAFMAYSTLLAVVAIGFYTLGAAAGLRSQTQLEAFRAPENPMAQDIEAVQARADSALAEIRTLYQGVSVLASYYAHREHGRLTASGERFDMHRMTAASRTLAFGTIVILENRDNGRLAVCRINDRGPFVAGRSIDVSLGVARELGMERSGLATVRMWALRIPTGEMAQGRASEGD